MSEDKQGKKLRVRLNDSRIQRTLKRKKWVRPQKSRALGADGSSSVYNGKPTATSSLSVDAALKLLAAWRVKLDWGMCLLREQMALKRCFKYLSLGHITETYTS